MGCVETLPPFMAVHWWFKVHLHWARTARMYTWAVKKSQRMLIISHGELTLCLTILWTVLCSFMFLVIPFWLKQCLTTANTSNSYVKTKSFFLSYLWIHHIGRKLQRVFRMGKTSLRWSEISRAKILLQTSVTGLKKAYYLTLLSEHEKWKLLQITLKSHESSQEARRLELRKHYFICPASGGVRGVGRSHIQGS